MFLMLLSFDKFIISPPKKNCRLFFFFFASEVAFGLVSLVRTAIDGCCGSFVEVDVFFSFLFLFSFLES